MILFPNGIQGLADSKWSGVRGSAYRLVGIDYRSEPGVIKAHQKMSKLSGSTVTELCKVALPISDGSKLWFSSESGKIWREVSGTFTLLGSITIPDSLIQTAVDKDESYVPSEDSQPFGLWFKSDGTKMYVLGLSNNSVFQYSLSTAWDVSTASYDTVTFDATTQDGSVTGLAFSADGTKMYIAGTATDTVYQYTLSTAWDLSTAAYASKSILVSSQTTAPGGITFKPDGTALYVASNSSDSIYQYTLGTAWDLSTASYASKVLDVSAENTSPKGLAFNSDGTKLFVSTSQPSSKYSVYGYSLSTPYDLATATYANDALLNPNSSLDTFCIFLRDNDVDFYFGLESSGGIFHYEIAEEDLSVTPLSAEEFAVPDGVDGPDADTLDDEMTQYVYFTTENRILRIPVATITDLTTIQYLAQFLNGDDTYHPMKIANNNRLFIGDKFCLAQVDEFGVITLESDLSVREPERITILGNFDVDLLVGTKRLDEKSRVLRWDTESETWYGEDVIYEGEIHAFLDEDNFTYAIVGDFGQMHYYDGEKLLKHTRIPGTYGSSAKCKVNANAVGYFMGVPIFGVSNVTGNPNLQGIYSYGQYSKDYNITMDLSFPISSGEFTGMEIGAIIVQGTDVYAAWKSGTAVGVDKLDWTTKYYGAYIETMVLNNAADRAQFKAFDKALADYIEMPASTAIVMQYSKNYAAYVTMEQVDDTKLFQLRSKETIPEIGAMQLKFTFNTNSNDSPKIENFHGNFKGEEAISA